MEEDIYLITAILENRNQDALDNLYKSILPKVRNYVLNNNGNSEDAKDVFQDAIISFFHAVKTGKFDSDKSVNGYLFVIAKNIWRNKVRKQSKIVLNEELIVDNANTNDNQLEVLITEERQQLFLRIFNQLSESCQEILNLSIYENLPPRKIMAKLNITSIDVTRTNLYRCRKKLSELVLKNKKELSI